MYLVRLEEVEEGLIVLVMLAVGVLALAVVVVVAWGKRWGYGLYEVVGVWVPLATAASQAESS